MVGHGNNNNDNDSEDDDDVITVLLDSTPNHRGDSGISSNTSGNNKSSTKSSAKSSRTGVPMYKSVSRYSDEIATTFLSLVNTK